VSVVGYDPANDRTGLEIAERFFEFGKGIALAHERIEVEGTGFYRSVSVLAQNRCLN